MLDIKFIRENKDIVEMALKNRGRSLDLNLLLELSDKKKKLSQSLEELNRKRNEAAKSRDVVIGTQLKKDIEQIEQQYTEVEKDYVSMMLKVPNIPSVDTPIGKDDTENKVIRQWGNKPQFSFQPKEHLDLGVNLGIIDVDSAANISGQRFSYIKGDLVLLQFALLQYCLQLFTNIEMLQEIAKNAGVNIKVTPFVPVLPPMFVRPAVQNRMARFMTPEEHYMFPNDDLMLIGSAEHTLGPLHMDSIINEAVLPIRYVGYSSAFRREAGAHGKDTKGIIRQHQC